MISRHPPITSSTMKASDLKAMILASGLPRERFREKVGLDAQAFQRILDGQDPITFQLRIKLQNLFAPQPEGTLSTRDEWIIGEGPPPRRREYIIHTREPRFIARVIALDEETDVPLSEEQPANTTTGTLYQYGPSLLCELDWIDPQPANPEDLERLMQTVSEQLDWDV